MKFNSEYMEDSTKITETQELLLVEAKKAAQNSYTPYSGYSIGAAVHTETGNNYRGTAVENASYGMTICAEVSAITTAVSHGEIAISDIVVVGGNSDMSENITPTPCGRCRQIIYELSKIGGVNSNIVCSDLDSNEIQIFSIDELLPYSFGPSNLNPE